MINPSIPQASDQMKPRITVIGVGGAGGNAVNNMIRASLEGVEFVTANTDAQAMQQSLAQNKIQLGATITRGLGAGARADVGRAAAEEALEDILKSMQGSNMIFITAGMGGGTGTGAAPVIARAARENGILTVGVVTKPFHFEGSLRMKQAEAGIEALQEHVDTLIVIPNQNLFRIANEQTTFAEAFNMADQVLHSGVRGVTDLMVMPGLINLDFNDIRSVMSEMGKAMMGTGEAEGARRAVEAAEAAISNPLLDDVSMKGARGVLINITGGMDMTLFEVDEAANRIRDEVDPDANIIFGSTFDQSMNGKMRVSVVATGIDVETARRSGGADSLRLVSATSKPTLFNQQSSSSVMSGAAIRPQPTTATAQSIPSNTAPAAPSNTNSTLPQTATASSGAAPRTVAQAPSAPQSFATAPAARQAQPAATAQSFSRITGFSSQPQTTAQYSAPQSFAGNAALQMTPQMMPPEPAPLPSLSLVQAPTSIVEPGFTQLYDETNNTGLVPAETSPWANLRPISAAPAEVQAYAPQPAPQYQPAPEPQHELPSFLFAEEQAPKVTAADTPAAAQTAKKKGPSLFERVTGISGARRTETTELTPVAPAASRQGPHDGFSGLNLGNVQAAPAPVAEPQLLSQQGAKLSSTDEDLLNIPAFLRRQAN